jgi:hypothetical protein
MANTASGQLPGQGARIDFHQPVVAPYRHTHNSALAIDQVHLGGEAHQMDVMPGERELGA